MLAIYHSPHTSIHESLIIVEVASPTAACFFKAIKDKPDPGINSKIYFLDNNKIVKETFIDTIK